MSDGKPGSEERGDGLRRWVRLLTVPLTRSPKPPDRVEAVIGRGLHILFSRQDRLLLHLCISPRDDTPQAAERTHSAAVSYLGDMQPTGPAVDWSERVVAALRQVEGREGWPGFLRWTARQPAPTLPQASGDMEGRASSGDELLLRITGRCNAKCEFCSARGILPDLVEGLPQIERCLSQARERGGDQVSFTGGEPSLVRALPDYIRLAKTLGFQRVDLQTNGVPLARTERIAALIEAGLDSLFLSLHAADPAIHDGLLGLPGAHEGALEACSAALAAGLDVDINCVLTTRNQTAAAPLIRDLGRRFGARSVGICLSACAPQGWARAHLDLMPRLDSIADGLAEALDAGRELDLEVRIPGMCGVPMCVLPDRLEHFDEFRREHPPRLADRAFVDACDGCPVRDKCSGFWVAYLEAHGAVGLGAGAFLGR